MANKIPRVPVREEDPAIRATNFEEVCYGYDLEEATLEASRCLRCKNPRCITSIEQELPQVFRRVTGGSKAVYRCIYCEQEYDPHK